MKIAMIGAGSFFTDAITEGLCKSDFFEGCDYVLIDIDEKLLNLSLERNEKIIRDAGKKINISMSFDRKKALEGCDYVVTSCEQNRVPFWIKDLEIPAEYGVDQFMGENGGPGGQAHAMRNITMFMDICADIREQCPNAWLMNFTNPMSFVCTYFHRYSGVKALGFCHQVHGSLGVVAEMLGMEPGDLDVITGGVNHFNWLLDIRKKGTNESYMEEFIDSVKKNKYWQKIFKNIPPNLLTLDILKTFELYPVGYDDHICEYLPFFYDQKEWKEKGYHSQLERLKEEVNKKKRYDSNASDSEVKDEQIKARAEFFNVPFPKDGHHPYYQENPTEVMEAFANNTPTYIDSIVIPNNGAISNLPDDAVVDVPAIAIGGEVRSINVGPLPTFAMELCRRQITIHELLVEATVEGDRTKLIQSMALDPYVRSIKQAKNIAEAFLKYYKEELPQFSIS